MSEGEQKLVDTSGDYRYAVRSGEPVESHDWRSCRIVLTDQRLVLATNGGKQAVPHGRITVPDDPAAALPEGQSVGGGSPLEIGDNVVVVEAQGVEDFESEYCRAALHGEVILVRHPAVVGGVVQDAEWSKARFRLDEDRVVLATGEGTAEFPLADVGHVDRERTAVQGTQRAVVRVEHTDDRDRSVETHLSGTERHARALSSLLTRVIEDRGDDYELSEAEREVLMALYSGVSPFEMADFVGLPVDEVEEIYGDLLAAGAVDKVRERTEVTLNAQGRNMASEAMNQE